ncbi:hypothetical protein RFI_23452 [Reticulomyxa filosa]|uniref:Uncharacterized protein n=1 Tax=Reticulomyxa filosa TaxID=46433 RepID=X6MJW0_RETFI|nr:hypothetical protein RFI_23452 [Reticulomyxa filosa]|eukprot:ETO13916.1 hypothetical protein RFI_23452 [Reticulomyxa filosa]
MLREKRLKDEDVKAILIGVNQVKINSVFMAIYKQQMHNLSKIRNEIQKCVKNNSNGHQQHPNLQK